MNQQNHTTLIKIEGLNDKKDVSFYQGKRIAYIYRVRWHPLGCVCVRCAVSSAPCPQTSKDAKGSKAKVIWGRVSRPHGPNGVVKAKFRSNIPPKALGARVRVMLYPSRV